MKLYTSEPAAQRAGPLKRSPRMQERYPALIDDCRSLIARATACIRQHFDDRPEIRDWTWTDASSLQ